MGRKKKHSKAEIAAKLAQAEDMAAHGMLQSEIARALDVSVMTLHRWRKLPPEASPATAPVDQAVQSEDELDREMRIADLQLENSRLRRLVTDLLLEKMRLEEAAGGHSPPRDGRRRLVR
jgi:hypothetical protein